MPLVKKLAGKVWEVRTQLPTRISRVLFTVQGQSQTSTSHKAELIFSQEFHHAHRKQF
jgi:hypothetical protein